MGAIDRVFRSRRPSQERPLAAIIAGLWKAGEQGVWYDVEGFGDSWSNLGAELIANGSMSGTVGWTPNGATLAVVDGALEVTSTGSQPSARQAIATTPGRTYRLSYTLRRGTTPNTNLVRIGSTAGGTDIYSGGYSSSGAYSIDFVALTATTYIAIGYGASSVGQTSYWDDVSVRPWLGGASCALYQDAGGATPAYLPGKGLVDPPVGLLLDKRFNLARGPEKFTDSSVVFSGESSRVSAGVYRLYSSAGAYSLVDLTPSALVAGRWYELVLEVLSIANAGTGMILEGADSSISSPVYTTVGVKRCIVRATMSYIGVKRNGGSIDLTLGNVSVREISGNHAYQTTTTSRPTLSARYNQLTKSQDFSDAAVWVTQSSGTGSAPVRTKDYAAAPDGSMTATRLQLALNGGAAASDRSGVAQTVSSTTTGAGYGCAIWLKAASADSVGRVVLLRHVAGITYLPCVLTAEWKAFGRVEAAGTNYGVVTLELRGASGGASDSVDMLVWGADLRPANDGAGLPPYQRVVDANTYDTVFFPLYLRFDGVDDWLQTAPVDFSGTDKITLACSTRKQADTSVGELLGFSATPNLSAGGFGVLAPPSATPRLEVSVCGTTNGYVHVHSAAPETGVYVARLNLAVAGVADGKVSVRKNGAVVIPLQIGPGAGTGNFGNYPLYIGRRGGSSLPFNGRLHGLIICGAATPDATIAKIERYLNQKAKVF